MTVMERLVQKAATYSAHFIANEFRGGINERGPDREWVRGETDWYYTGALVEYPTSDRDLVTQFLQPSLNKVITDLKAALEQTPDSKLTFYGLLPETLSKYARMFTPGDVRFQAEVDNVVVLACGNYLNGKRRIWVHYQCTPLLQRAANIVIPTDAGVVE